MYIKQLQLKLYKQFGRQIQKPTLNRSFHGFAFLSFFFNGFAFLNLRLYKELELTM